MSLPSTAEFEALLGSFCVTKPEGAESWREFVAVPANSLNQDYELVKAASVAFWYRDNIGLTMEPLLKKITQELDRLGHNSNREMAAIVCALFAYSEGTVTSAIERFNLIFNQVVDAHLNQLFLFPQASLSTYRIEIGPFSIGSFIPDRLAYMSRKAGSDYYTRYEDGIRKAPFSVERKHRNVRLVYWHRLLGTGCPWTPKKGLAQTLMYLLDQYFGCLSAIYFVDFFAELKDLQELPIALGSGWFDLRLLRELLGSHQISVYLNIGTDNVGFVSPSSALVMNINMGGGNLGIPFTEAFLKKQFAFEGFGNSEIHQSLRSYCHFLALAAQHRHAGREPEAFLHKVIALDLLLGDSGSSSFSVSTRSAALVFKAIEVRYPILLKDLQRIYNARSKYVHEGKPPDPSLMQVLVIICGEIAFCLFRLQRDPLNQVAGFRDRWLKEVDFLIAATEAAKTITEDDLRRVGVATGEEARYVDFIAELKEPFTHSKKA